jgi:hypothetical protein
VSQISPPLRIVLLLALAVLGVFMLFLRPKSEVAAPPAKPNIETQAPATSAPSTPAETTQSGVTEAKPDAPAQPTAVDAELKGLPKPVAAALRHQKVLVLLFWNGRSADDRAVHAALKHVDRWNGRVSVQSAPIARIADYGRIARGVDVEQSPTVVVTDSQLRAETLVGYVDARTIDQAVVDALRNTTGLFASAYLRDVDALCVRYSNALAGVPDFYGGGSMKRADARLTAVDNRVERFVHDFKAIDVPQRWKAYQAASLADLKTFDGILSQYASAVTPTTSLASLLASEQQYKADARPVSKRINHRFDRKGLLRCGSDF